MSSGDYEASRASDDARNVRNALCTVYTELTGEKIPQMGRSEPMSISEAVALLFPKWKDDSRRLIKKLKGSSEDEWLRILALAKGDGWTYDDLKKISPFAKKFIVIVRPSGRGGKEHLSASLYDLDALIRELGLTLENFPNKEKRSIVAEIVFIRDDVI